MLIKKIICKQSFLSDFDEKPTRTGRNRCSEAWKTRQRVKTANSRGGARASTVPRRQSPREAWEGVPRWCSAAARVGARPPRVGRTHERCPTSPWTCAKKHTKRHAIFKRRGRAAKGKPHTHRIEHDHASICIQFVRKSDKNSRRTVQAGDRGGGLRPLVGVSDPDWAPCVNHMTAWKAAACAQHG